MSMLRSALVVFGIVAVLAAPAARASRCHSGLTNGPHCQCPDYSTLVNAPGSHVKCRPGWTPVTYDLDHPFAPEGVSSHMTIRAGDLSQCPNLEKDVPLHGILIGCWSKPLYNGCRKFRVTFNGLCLDADEEPLGAGCNGDCATFTTGQLAIGTAGSATFQVCPPLDPNTSCRSTNTGGGDEFRFQTGGLCDTYDCEAHQPGTEACAQDWGASYWGFDRVADNPPGSYDWLTGGFRVSVQQRRQTCGKMQGCLGFTTPAWTVVLAANPAAGFTPPCIPNGGGNPCQPSACIP